MPSLSTLLGAARRRLLALGAQPIPEAEDRRRFLRQAGTAGAAAAATGLMLPSDAWAAVEARAARAGIVPGTVVDAAGRPVRAPSSAQPYVGEIMLVGYNFATRGWALCDGQLIAISANDALFSLLGTIYGGDGRTTFALPDLRGRFPMHAGNGPGLTDRRLGQKSGAERVTLTAAQAPSHTHVQPVSGSLGTTRNPNGGVPAVDNGADQIYGPTATSGHHLQPMSAAGGGEPHENRPPYLALYYQISLYGIYPSRN